ncbi:unnamed protein product [Mytilus coruscus]|uniref:Uncharacterized protein n=1 Tax=Mytilus coruscus TaxID=42192 RepID=A0A6J8EK16_MYTCO|nr:unnamed protein product [Mytilus coruscus]
MSLDVLELTDTPGQPMAQVDMRELRKQQREDSLIGFWVRAVKDKKIPNKVSFKNTKENLTMYRSFQNLKLVRGVLYREIQDNDQKKQNIDGDTHNANEVNTEQKIVLEPPMPRRSARRRKKPEWHSFYQMNQMSVRQSLPETNYVLVNLISSGVLQGVSETMVSRIVNTILDVG